MLTILVKMNGAGGFRVHNGDKYIETSPPGFDTGYGALLFEIENERREIDYVWVTHPDGGKVEIAVGGWGRKQFEAMLRDQLAAAAAKAA